MQQPTDGTYRFVVSSYGEFWRRYLSLHPSMRHAYEVIPEGHAARLYMDIEFLTENNTHHDGDAMMCTLIGELRQEISQRYGSEAGNGEVVELDSSTAVKFSRHLHMPGVVF